MTITPIRVLLQTTIPESKDDWTVDRFSLLRGYLASLIDGNDHALAEVTARNRESDGNGDDPVLKVLDRSAYDELWLFAVDAGKGLTAADCAGITRFRQRGGGILLTRDHQDLRSSSCYMGGIGAAHFFHSRNPEPDAARRVIDDAYTRAISWPNYHFGGKGKYQEITAVEPVHDLLRNPASPTGRVRWIPAHPHGGAVGVPAGELHARVIAMGKSRVTGRPLKLAVAFESYTDADGNRLGRGVAESSFHHFADYNWDTTSGCPSFVDEPPGDAIKRSPQVLEDMKAYVRNLALWLSPSGRMRE